MSLKVKFRTLFPALVTAASPLTLVKTGLSYAFGIDIDALKASLNIGAGGSNGQIQYNNGGALDGVIGATTNSTTLLALAPTASSTQHGVTVSHTLPVGSPAANTSYSANQISIINNGYQTPAGGTADTFGLYPVVSGLRVDYTSTGSGIGTLPIHIAGLFATKATSVGQQLVGLNGTVYTNVNSSGQDGFWAVVGYAHAGPSSNFASLYGLEAEVTVAPGATVANRIGVGSVSMGPTTGTSIDGAFVLSTQADKYGLGSPWSNAMVLWNNSGAAPFTANFVISNMSFTAGAFVNLPNVTFTNKIFDFGSSIFQMNGSGHMTIGGATLGTNTLAVGGTQIIQTTSGAAFSVGPNGATNPVLNVDASTASQAAGLNIAGAATGGTVALAAVDSGANTNISLNGKGTGQVRVGNTSSGQVQLAGGGGGVLISSAITYGGVTLSNAVTGTGNLVASTSPTLTTPNLGTPSALTLTNATGLPTTGLTGTLQAAQEPAHTGDMTNTAGSLATTVVAINGVNQTTAWTTYSPTATAQTPGVTPPTFTSVTGRYKQIGKTIICQMEAVVNVAGTAAGNLQITLPLASRAGNYVGSAFESAITGRSGAGVILGGIDTANARARDATGTTFFANGADVTISIVYEIP